MTERNGFDLKPIDEDFEQLEEPTFNVGKQKLGQDAPEVLGLNSAFIRRALQRLGRTVNPRTMTVRDAFDVYDLARPSPSLVVPFHFTPEGAPLLVALTRYGEAGKPGATYGDKWVAQESVTDLLDRAPTGSVQTVVTSPPYWGHRIYKELVPHRWSDGSESHYGGESTPEAYVRHTLEILFKLRRVLAEGATVWWNVGDSYNTRTQIRTNSAERLRAMRDGDARGWKEQAARRHSAGHPYLQDKDLCLIPQLIAVGAQRLGYWCRSWITWDKENTMPETVRDRPTTSHEAIIMLARDKNYKFHKDAWKDLRVPEKFLDAVPAEGNANLRTVWRFRTASGRGIHGAQFPIALPLRCIALSTDEDDLVLDPFTGSGTTGVAARLLNRRFVGCDVVPDYVEAANKRIGDTPIVRNLESFAE